MMKRIFTIFCLFASALFCWLPRADAGAIAIVVVDDSGWYPLGIAADDPIRDTIVSTYKKYAPYGYNVYCTKEIDQQYDPYSTARDEKTILQFAKSAGYDFLITLWFPPVVDPDVVHFQHPMATFDFYDTSSSIYSRMYSIHDGEGYYTYNVCREYHGHRGETYEQAQYQALLKVLDADADFFHEKMTKDLQAEAPVTGSTQQAKDFYHQYIGREI